VVSPTASPVIRLVLASGALVSRIYLGRPLGLERTFLIVRRPLSPRHPIAHNAPGWYGNINPLSIAYAFRPRLRIRLTLGGFTFPRKP
jgi:hypothetical protein